jgi:hypothetical protein
MCSEMASMCGIVQSNAPRGRAQDTGCPDRQRLSSGVVGSIQGKRGFLPEPYTRRRRTIQGAGYSRSNCGILS